MLELIKDLMLPSHLVALLGLAGLTMLLVRRTRNLARLPLAASAVLYLVFSNGLLAALLIAPLEYRYSPIDEGDPPGGVDTAVVLTAYAADDPRMPLSSRAASAALYRVVEACRLYDAGIVKQVFISGHESAARIMADLLDVLGIPAADIVVGDDAAHTVDSANSVRDTLGVERILLVTSAGHMPRAMAVFEAAGLQPVAAPTDYQLPREAGRASPMPAPLHIQVSDLAINEYGGLLWYRLSGTTEKFW